MGMTLARARELGLARLLHGHDTCIGLSSTQLTGNTLGMDLATRVRACISYTRRAQVGTFLACSQERLIAYGMGLAWTSTGS